jgi:hypothetical protein
MALTVQSLVHRFKLLKIKAEIEPENVHDRIFIQDVAIVSVRLVWKQNMGH